MIVAGKTTFQVIFVQSGEQWVESTFDNIHDAEDCVDRLENENENNAWVDGVIIQEISKNDDVLYHKYYDFS
jgi:hypothetical protein